MEIKVGDLVTHVTGGRVMVVVRIDDNGIAACAWVNDDGRSTALFPTMELRRKRPPRGNVRTLFTRKRR